ncbi:MULTISPECIES: vWA domain-containing protein [unclassified Amycolatopsis]|uniref:vWA domain-containing protein n=1 Tax=unclassified Amycolatopsis TaxID=2618356 RepID=UPI002875804C|nr:MULTISPECIES: vWA domain-containing protein [unclassified Amycolatopsis]MDS0134719.1 VWA domain-containing protein [Amycolatopsis sp. 505]MDS0147382.1 VWA domain-containing protein [Amycolatopsis sp. CM201R]
MSDAEIRMNLATLVVDALELGTGKNERDVIDDLFAAFGLEFATLDKSFPRQTPRRASALRTAAAEQLAGAAPTAGALLNEVVRCGGRFVAMVDEIYRYLAAYSATTTGTSDTFHLQRGDVDEEQLVISPEFIEQVRSLEQRLTTLEIGLIDHDALQRFTVADNGAFYGSWPIRSNDGIRLLDGLLALAWIRPEIDSRATGTTVQVYVHAPVGWEVAARAAAEAAAAGERLVSTAQWLIRAYTAHIDALPMEPIELTGELFTITDHYDWLPRRVQSEVERYRSARVITTGAEPTSVSNIKRRMDLGLDHDLRPVAVEAVDSYGTAMGHLAGFVAEWRSGRWRPQSRRELERELLDDPAALTLWLNTLADASREAADWLASEVFHPTGSTDATVLLDSIEEFLNLPLWRQRELLYEVWVLCTTIDVCEQGGWVPRLVRAPGSDGVWVLSRGATEEPVCRLEHGKDRSLTLDVWHEPRCRTTDGELTPDVTVSTPPPYRRELVVIEAKDRIKMPRGRHHGDTRSSTAWGVADRYASSLRPHVTWVVNHCDYRQNSDPDAEYGGSVWAQVRLAEQFRPGNVPAAFVNTLQVATTPPGVTTQEPVNGLVLVVDRTGSMNGRLRQARKSVLLDDVFAPDYHEFRIIAYTDHNDGEPFLVRSLGPFPSLADALDAAEGLPLGGGGDFEEALEDALQRCRELVTDVGPRTILVLTDAPAHDTRSCPYRIDAQEETEALLDLGCRVLVADDWLRRPDPTWTAVAKSPGFALLPLTSIVSPTRTSPA